MVTSARTSWLQVLIKLLPYILAWAAAASLDFGVPAFLALCIVAMFSGTRERWQSENNRSAYSVFNERGERIAGTLTADQIDGQLRNGGHAARDQADQASIGGHWWGGGKKLGASDTSTAAVAAPDDQEARRRQRVAAAAAADARARQAST